MADTLSKERRSQLMGKVKSKDTTPEVYIRRLLHSLDYRYRIHYKLAPGTPDLAFPSRRKAILIHGCFWHGHRNCKKARLPKSNAEFWKEKIQRNRARDRKIENALRKQGWSVTTVWQCELNRGLDALSKIIQFLDC